jgi:hypothetical protein
MGQMKKFVFIDESIRDQYTIAAVIVPITKVGEYRRVMLSLRTKGARSFHIGKERKERQQIGVRTLADLDYCTFIYASARQSSMLVARQAALRDLLAKLDDSNVSLVLDETTMKQFDFQILAAEKARRDVDLDFVHLQRHYDSGLWGADILAWSIGTQYQNLFFDARFR